VLYLKEDSFIKRENPGSLEWPVASAQWKNNQHMIPSSRVRVQGAGMSEIAI